MEIFSERFFQKNAAKAKCSPRGSRSNCGCHMVCPCKRDIIGFSGQEMVRKQAIDVAVKVAVHVKERHQ